MNTQSSAVPESFGRQEVTPAVISATRPLYWSVRRELWEFRSIYIAPLVAAAVVLFGFLISSFAGIWEKALSLDPSQPKVAEPYNFAALLIMGSTFLVSLFYCLEALHAERRDRSILFWKSLPVSDLTTVLSKATIPLVILPLLTFAIIAATQWVMLLISIAVLSVSGQSVAALWDPSVVIPDVGSAALPPCCHSRSLVRAILWMVVAGFSVGATCASSVGLLTAARDWHFREDCLPHHAFRRDARTPIRWRSGRHRVYKRQHGDGSADAPDSAALPDQPRPMDRSRDNRGIPRGGSSVAPLSWTDLRQICPGLARQCASVSSLKIAPLLVPQRLYRIHLRSSLCREPSADQSHKHQDDRRQAPLSGPRSADGYQPCPKCLRRAAQAAAKYRPTTRSDTTAQSRSPHRSVPALAPRPGIAIGCNSSWRPAPYAIQSHACARRPTPA